MTVFQRTHIEELEEKLKTLGERAQDFCTQTRISDREAIKWQQRFAHLRMTPRVDTGSMDLN